MKRLHFLISTCIIGLLVFVSACDKVEFKEEEKMFAFSSQSITLRQGEIRKLQAPLFYTNYNMSQINFEILHTNIVYINENMELIAANAGETEIRAFLLGQELGRMTLIVRE